jgi:ureidoacrylate peracid hydrolase
MTRHTYGKEITALLVIHPYDNLISEEGKIWGRIRAAAEADDWVPHAAGPECRAEAKLRVFYALHQRYRPGDYKTLTYIAPVQKVA